MTSAVNEFIQFRSGSRLAVRRAKTCKFAVRIASGLSVRYCALLYHARCALLSDVAIVHIGRLLLNLAWERVAAC